MIANKKTLLSMAVALAVTACGGGGGGSAPVTVVTSSGLAVDGYLSGSSVLCDTNNNGVADTGESKVITDAGAFAFSPACASTIVVNGGTNIDTSLQFKGLLKAPAGSAVATPLTSLMVSGGLTAEQVATALGLPAGTDVSKIDPMSNSALQKKTLAMQQIIQQVADTLGGLAGSNNSDAIQAIYSQVAKAVASTLAASPTTPLVDVNGNVSLSLVSSIVKKSVENVAASTDTALATAKTGISTFSATSVAELISGAIAIQAQTLVNVSDATLVAQTTSLQSNPTISNAAVQIAALLTTATDSSVNLAAAGAALQQLVDTDASNNAAASTAIATAVTTQAQAASIPAPAISVATWSTPSNYLAIVNDSVTLNSTTYTLSQFLAGVGPIAKPDTVSFPYALNGTPIPAGGSQVSVGLEMAETGTTRKLQVILDQANLSVANGQLTVTVPAGAKLYAYGQTSSGASANLTLSNDVANQLITTSGSNLTFNATNVLNSIVAKVGAQSGSPFANLLNAKGTFTLKVVVSNLPIQSATAGAVKGLAVSVTGSGQSMTGAGVEGKVTVN